MTIDHVPGPAWTRKHDDSRAPLLPSTPRTVYPRSLEDLIRICREHAPGERLRATGSHWALSPAAISDHTFIETRDPTSSHAGLDRTLSNVIPPCLNRVFVQALRDRGAEYPVHVEAGKRIFELYAELDRGFDVGDASTLAGYLKGEYGDDRFGGSWAFETLGGAGGQTIVGAFMTGTHGGDWDKAPIADSVKALHLVADGGRHYWVEPVSAMPLTDDDLLRAEYSQEKYGGPDNFNIVRDTNLFQAILVSAGRFGIVYSVVLRAVRQYMLHERRRLHLWQDVKGMIKNRNSSLYREANLPGFCFLQLAVCLSPHLNFHRNLVGVTTRWRFFDVPLDPPGRKERVGDDGAKAGASHSFEASSDALASVCASGSFLQGVLEKVISEIEDLVSSNGAAVGAGVAAVAAAGGAGIIAMLPALFALLLVLRELLDLLDADDRFGEFMDEVRSKLLGDDTADPARRAAGVFLWQLIYYYAFSQQQSDSDYEGISYAIMDRHDYLDRSCTKNVDSVEVFFDALDDRLVAFVDALIAYETAQQFRGKSFVGYASLRFQGDSGALLAMQRWALTCSVEVACLRDVEGSQDLIDFAVQLARNPNINGYLHWGQRNDYDRPDVERRYRPTVDVPFDRIAAWRAALASVTENGRLDAFSSEFTRRTGLEVR